MNAEQIEHTKAAVERLLNLLDAVQNIQPQPTGACTVNWAGQSHCYETTKNNCENIIGGSFDGLKHCTSPASPSNASDPKALKADLLVLLGGVIDPITRLLRERAEAL
jgi:hypothetical protein